MILDGVVTYGIEYSGLRWRAWARLEGYAFHCSHRHRGRGPADRCAERLARSMARQRRVDSNPQPKAFQP